jgi:mRNA interferase RelE/StbE
VWAPSARRAIARIPEKVATAVIEYIYAAVAENPKRAGHALRFELEGSFAASRGDFRIIYEIHDDLDVVSTQTIEHRGDVYRPC